jgi:hypothetical protein
MAGVVAGDESEAANDKSDRRGAKTVFYNIQECTKRGEDGMETSVIHDFIQKKEQIETAARALKAI